MTPLQLAKLEKLYREQLLPVYVELEPERNELLRGSKRADYQLIIPLALLGLIVAAVGSFCGTPGWIQVIFGVFLVMTALVGKYLKPNPYADVKLVGYPRAYKERIIKLIGETFCDELHYRPEQTVLHDRCEQSGFFPRLNENDSSIWGEDFFSGRIGQTCFEMSEIRFVQGKDTIFRGVLFVAEFNKFIPGRMTLNSTGTVTHSHRRVELEDPMFMDMFGVEADHPTHARYILTPGLMSRLVAFQNRRGVDFKLSVVGKFLYIAFSRHKDFFEAPDVRTRFTFETVKTHAREFEFVLGVVEELNLNTRIWRVAA